MLLGRRAVKTYGWAVLSGVIFLVSALLAGSPLWPALVATGTAVLLKTPFYWLYEHAFDWIWHPAKPEPGAEPVTEVVLSVMEEAA